MKSSYAFISYSRKNEDVVKKIVKEFEEEGQKVFIDYRDIPPGSVFAAEIVKAIEDATCCVLMLSDESNNSNMVLNEVNSATNHDKVIIPLKLNSDVTPSKAMEFYIGKNNWIDYVDRDSLKHLISIINSLEGEEKEKSVVYKGPVVLPTEKMKEIGYDTRRRVVETIEIDYLTLGNAPMEFVIDSEIEGDPDQWMDFANNYPETASFLVSEDKVVGYSQIELINREDYDEIIAGKKMIDADMQEFYAFGGNFCCYIAIMPILYEYENQGNYKMLVDDLFAKLVRLNRESFVTIESLGISVYSKFLEKILVQLGFAYVGNNPANGRIYELDLSRVHDNNIIKRVYPDFYEIYGV